MTLKQRFLDDAEKLSGEFNVLVTAVKLPSGAIETITNHQELKSKVEYIASGYDNDFRLDRNKEVQIVGYLIV